MKDHGTVDRATCRRNRGRAFLLRPPLDPRNLAGALLGRGHDRLPEGSADPGFLIIPALLSRCATPCERMPNDSPPSTAWKSCSFVKRISAKKIGSRKFLRSGGTTPAWCASSRPWNLVPPTHLGTTRKLGRPTCGPDDGKCLHYYFYFIDQELGLGYVRVPNWCPFRLQVYLNGHHWLAGQLRRHHIDSTLLDHAFTQIADWNQAQRLANEWRVETMHQKLDQFAQRYCPVIAAFKSPTTGAWIRPSRRPISSSAARRTCKPSMTI